MKIGSVCSSLLAAVGLVCGAQAQSLENGALVVSTEALTDPRFSESVVLLVSHDPRGTLGLVINRPTRVEPASVSSELGYLQDSEVRVYYGGPVSPTRALLLLRDPPAELVEGMPILEDVYIAGDLDVLRGNESAARAESLRIYAGHAEWAPGQLESEVAAGHWRVVPGRAELVFSREPLELWQRLASLEFDVVVDALGLATETVADTLSRPAPPSTAAATRPDRRSDTAR